MTPTRLSIPGLKSENVTFNGIRLHYWVGGEPAGPPVLLWHGFLTIGRCWRHVAPALVDAGCAVLVPEVPERLVVGHERAFLTWFFDRHTANRAGRRARDRRHRPRLRALHPRGTAEGRRATRAGPGRRRTADLSNASDSLTVTKGENHHGQ